MGVNQANDPFEWKLANTMSMKRPVNDQRTTVGIIGMGLIGSSIAAAVRSCSPGVRLKGYDSCAVVREQVRLLNLVDEVSGNAAQCAAETDLMILCVPVGAMESVAKSMAESLAPHTIVTDVGSTKSEVSSILRRILPDAKVVPAHPIAGSDRSGPAAGTAELFKDRWCILTPEPDTSLEVIQTVSTFWQSLGARVEIMAPEDHDLIAAAISHVPHLLAFSAVAAVAALEKQHGRSFIKFAAAGFQDFTRLAAANPLIWKDILLTNKAAIADVSTVFRDMVQLLDNMIVAGDEQALLGLLEKVQQARLNISAGS